MEDENALRRRRLHPTILHFNRTLTDLARTDRTLLTTPVAGGGLWDAHDWRSPRHDGAFAGTLTWGPFVFECDLERREVYLESVSLQLPSGKLKIGSSLALNTGIYDRAEFVEGQWWVDLAQWINLRLAACIAAEQRRREALKAARDGEVQRARSLELLARDAEYAGVRRPYGGPA